MSHSATLVDYVTTSDIFAKYYVLQDSASVSMRCWQSPFQGFLKLNTNGSWKGSDKDSGGGGD